MIVYNIVTLLMEMYSKIIKKTYLQVFFNVPEAGVEPARYCYHWILNPARLPIPPLGQIIAAPKVKSFLAYTNESIENSFGINQFFYLCQP